MPLWAQGAFRRWAAHSNRVLQNLVTKETSTRKEMVGQSHIGFCHPIEIALVCLAEREPRLEKPNRGNHNT